MYLISDNGKVNAYDAATGKPIWEHTYSPGRGSCPSAFAISDGVLYFGGGEEQGSRSNGRFLWALNAATGQELWRFAAKPESYSQGECVKSPAVSNGIVVAAAWNIIYALDAKTGQLKWTQEIRRNVDGRSRRRTLSEPLITGGIVYSYFQEGIAGSELSSGKPVFEFPGAFPAEQQDNRMAAAGGVLYFTGNLEDSRAQTSGIGYLYALDLQTKQLLWKHKVNRPSRFEAVARWATRYFIPSDKALYYENESILVKVK